MDFDNCIPVTHGDEVEYLTGGYPEPVCGDGHNFSQFDFKDQKRHQHSISRFLVSVVFWIGYSVIYDGLHSRGEIFPDELTPPA